MQKQFLSLIAGLTFTVGGSVQKSMADVPARVDAIRDALEKQARSGEHKTLKPDSASSLGDRILAQWVNWTNWGNWPNWNNWHNWSNNWTNWINY